MPSPSLGSHLIHELERIMLSPTQPCFGAVMPTDATTVQDGLRLRVRRLIDDGSLPPESHVQIDARYGDGSVCSAFDQQDTPYQVKYTISLHCATPSLSFHLACYAVWQL